MGRQNTITKITDIFLIIIGFFLTNLTAFSLTTQFPDLSGTLPYIAIVIVALLIGILFIQIHLLSLWDEYIKTWKRLLPLLVFIIFCIFSIFWSVYIKASLFKLSFLILSSALGVYFGVRYNSESIFEIIRYLAIFSVIASYLFLFFVPPLARLDNPQYMGAWRGIFWHRNHMGNLVAFFSAVFFMKIVIARKQKIQVIVNSILFLLSAVLVFGSRSATGILIFLFLNAVILLLVLWLKFRSLLKKKHYFVLIAVAGILIILAILNAHSIFYLLGRNSTLTGRIPLWKDLLANVWSKKPLFGHGFGAIWNLESFRVWMQTRHGWPYEVYFSDNGFLDILLNTGVLGLLLFLVFYISTIIRSARKFVKELSVISFFPLMITIYILIANISYSFLLEVDQFVWMLLVIASALSIRSDESIRMPIKSAKSPQP